jgi:hypothetical protein
MNRLTILCILLILSMLLVVDCQTKSKTKTKKIKRKGSRRMKKGKARPSTQKFIVQPGSACVVSSSDGCSDGFICTTPSWASGTVCTCNSTTDCGKESICNTRTGLCVKKSGLGEACGGLKLNAPICDPKLQLNCKQTGTFVSQALFADRASAIIHSTCACTRYTDCGTGHTCDEDSGSCIAFANGASTFQSTALFNSQLNTVNSGLNAKLPVRPNLNTCSSICREGYTCNALGKCIIDDSFVKTCKSSEDCAKSWLTCKANGYCAVIANENEKCGGDSLGASICSRNLVCNTIRTSERICQVAAV